MSADQGGTGGRGSIHERPKGLHVATLTHRGGIWEAYLELDDDPHRLDTCRAHLRFDPINDIAGQGPIATGVIIIEPSYEEAVTKVRSFDARQLEGLLRSALPEEEEEGREEDEEA